MQTYLCTYLVAGTITHLAWSSDSTLLAVQASTKEEHRVQLWARSNWRWYLKQELRSGSGSELHIGWNEEGPNELTLSHGKTIRTVCLYPVAEVRAIEQMSHLDSKVLKSNDLCLTAFPWQGSAPENECCTSPSASHYLSMR